MGQETPVVSAPLCFVTGAGGRLGRFVLAALREKGYRVRALERSQGREPSFPSDVEVAAGDLSSISALEPMVADADYVFHLAGLVSHSAPFPELYAANYEGTRNLLEACRKSARGLKRFVYASSISVYGKEPLELPASEATPCRPTDGYGSSKLLAEEAVKQYSEFFPTVILRPAIIYGEGFDEAYIPMLSRIEKGRMKAIGGGRNVIPFVHARDVARAFVLAAESQAPSGMAFVVASPERLTQNQILSMAASALGAKPPSGSVPAWLVKLSIKLYRLNPFSRGKGGLLEEHVDTIAADRFFDTRMAEDALGFSAQVPLAQGIAEMVEYYRAAEAARGDSR
jgi:nucleoside-diphosphate-sugar epimerase